MQSSISVSAVYCEDVRTELHGKVTALGIYGSEGLRISDNEERTQIQMYALLQVTGPADLNITRFKIEHFINDELFHQEGIEDRMFPEFKAALQLEQQYFNQLDAKLSNRRPAILVYGFTSFEVPLPSEDALLSTRISISDELSVYCGALPILYATSETPSPPV